MLLLLIQLRGVVLFYRSVAPFMLGITALLVGCVLVPGLQEGWGAGALPALVLAKLLTGLAVWYLAEQLRPHQYWFYYNLGIARGWLWVGVLLLDGLLFLGIALGVASCWV